MTKTESYEATEKLLNTIGFNKEDLKNKEKLEELRKKLNALNIDKFAYDLNGGLPNETYCI